MQGRKPKLTFPSAVELRFSNSLILDNIYDELHKQKKESRAARDSFLIPKSSFSTTPLPRRGWGRFHFSFEKL